MHREAFFRYSTNESMVGTGTMHKEMLQNAATDTGLMKAQVQASIKIYFFDKQIIDAVCFAC